MLRDRVLDLPWVAGSGKAADGQAGYVFCARVGDQDRPLFRWVPLDTDRTIMVADVTGDTLTCLARAACTATTPATMPDEALDTAYDAWEVARADILDWWRTHADPRAIAPAIPKPMRDAAAFLEENPPVGMEPERLYRILDAISAPYDPRTQRMMRQALQTEGTDQDRATAIVELVSELGLQAPDPTEPLPEINLDDVHLVCWMALV